MDCKLSHMPIGKNLLYVSEQLMFCCRNNLQLNLTKDFWIWSDVEKNTDRLNWSYYFDDWTLPDINLYNNEIDLLSDCCANVFRPKKHFIKNEINTEKKIIGIHVRRGDAKYYDLKKVRPVCEYVNIIKKYNPSDYCIYCASDSLKEVVPELKKYLSDYDIFYSDLSYNLPIFPEGLDMEFFCSNNKKYIFDVVTSAIQDIHSLSKSEIFIGAYKDSVFALFVCLLVYKNKNKFIDIFSKDSELSLNDTKLGIPI